MNRETWAQLEELFHAALELSPEERATFLDQECAGRQELRHEVEALLAHDDPGESLIDEPQLLPAVRALAAEWLAGRGSSGGPQTEQVAVDSLQTGQIIRNFRILGKIGQGGMGEVYKAVDLKLGRHVAIKLLPRSSMKDEQARVRFLREARAASALNHPNIVTIHAIEETDDEDFIVMEYVEGETLQSILQRGPMDLERVISTALQIVDAIAAAHSSGIIHRDLKPANIIVTPPGIAKILDFGLARFQSVQNDDPDDGIAASNGAVTGTRTIVGSISYMSPEQARGESLDARSDIFSLGSVLYEAVTGRRPFEAPSLLGILNEIISVDPPPPSTMTPALPPELDRLIARALEKDRLQRYATADLLADDLKRLNLAIVERESLEASKAARRRRSRRLMLVAIVALLVAAAGLRIQWREKKRAWARGEVAKIEALVREERYFDAWVLARGAQAYIPNDPDLIRLMPTVTDRLSVISEPADASVYLQRFVRGQGAPEGDRELIGTTPITDLLIGRDEYIVEIVKDGHIPVRRTISSTFERVQRSNFSPGDGRREVRLIESAKGVPTMAFDADAPIVVRAKLDRVGEAPERMVPVPGGLYGLVGSGSPTDATVSLDAFRMDQFEVTNREYREFIDSGGYSKRQYWKVPFRRDGGEISWEVAMSLLKDRTGLPGPRSWSNQTFPAGKEDHPVTDVSWFEAAAYAEFRGKQLPSVFQWEKAARNGTISHLYWFVMPWGLSTSSERLGDRANLLGSGTVPVGSLPFGMSPFGVFQMAGNVAEWCANPQGEGYSTTGGSWKDPLYMFASFGGFPGFYSSNSLGFRCVLNAREATGDQGTFALDAVAEVPRYTPPDAAQVEAMRRHYEYDQSPLDPRIEEVVETDSWRREKVTYTGADGDRAIAWLYLPKNAVHPVQVIHYLPSDAAYYGLTVPEEVEAYAAPYIKAGRAVFAVVLRGYRERPFDPGFTLPKMSSVRFRDLVVRWAIDLQIGIDYLSTRPEIDPARITAMVVSGNNRKLALAAVESRYAAVILVGAGILRSWAGMIPETNGVNFVSSIRVPKLMIHGRYDEAVMFESEARPLYELLTEPKRLVVFDQGHIPPLEVAVPIVDEWLDATLGAVKRE